MVRPESPGTHREARIGASVTGAVASSVDGVAVAYEDTGSGSPTLFFIHGLAGDRSDFDDQVSYFADRYRVIAVDLPGNRGSGRGRASWTMAAYGEDVASVVDGLGLDDVVLVGHSLGGDVTVEAALRLGSRVRALIWLSSYRSLGAPKSRDQLDEWMAPFHTDFAAAADDLARRNFGPHADRDLVDGVAARVEAADRGMVIQLLEAKMHNEPAVLAGLAEITVPVVAINPDFKPSDRASFASHGVELKIMAGIGHFVMLEDPDGLNELLETTIAALPPPP